MVTPAELHRRILALPTDKQLHVAADMVATGKPAIIATVIPLLEYVICDLKRVTRAAKGGAE
jgi:hypothetical protein